MMSRFNTALVGLVLATLSVSCIPTLYGTPYEVMTCSQYVNAEIHNAAGGMAPDWFAGRVPRFTLVAEYKDIRFASGFKDGDVAAFHGVHVAVFHDGMWTDSDPVHSGVGRMQMRPNDPWFIGPVRIFRRIQ